MNPRLKMRGALVGAVVALTFALTWSLAKVPSLEDSADRSESKANTALTRVDQLEQQVAANGSALDKANRQLVALGKTPVPVPSAAPTTPLPEPDQFTADEAAAVRVIVADLIARQKVQITQAEISQIARVAAAMVPKPKDGKSPTPAEVQRIVTVAIAAYCVGDKCVGKPGADGKPGQDGTDGADGKDAPEVTDDELLAAAQTALASYCAQETKPCDGTDGKDGADAPVIADMDCVGDGADSYWLIQFNRGPDKTALGPCRIGPEPPLTERTGN